jgi:hypothetical protein
MSPSGGAVLERESPRAETARPSVHPNEKRPAPGRTQSVIAPAETSSANGHKLVASSVSTAAPPAHTTDVMTLHAAFGNAAVARAAMTGEVAHVPTASAPAMAAAPARGTESHVPPSLVPPSLVSPIQNPAAHSGSSPAHEPPVAALPSTVAASTTHPAAAGTAPAPAKAEVATAAPSTAAAHVAKASAAAGTPSGQAVSHGAPHKTAGAGAAVGKGGAETATGTTKAAASSARNALAPLVTALHHRAAKARIHSAPGVPVASAQAAAIRPSIEQSRKAAMQTVSNLGAAKTATKQVDRVDFKTKLKNAIEAATPKPKTEKQADEVMETGASNASNAVKNELSAQNQAAGGQLKSAASTEVLASSQSVAPEVGLKPEPMGEAPAPVAAGPAVPAPLPAQQLDYSADRAPTDKAMADAGVTKEQLEQGNEPEFKQNVAARADAEKHEAAAQQGYRDNEAGIRAKAEQSAQGQVAHGLANIHAARTAKIGSVVGQQHATREKHAAEHERITARINEIKKETREAVEEILRPMESDASAIFEKGLADAEQAYQDTFKEEKGGIGTWLTTWGDSWKDLIEHSLNKAREKYLATVNEAIDKLADGVDAKLDAAKRRVTDGNTQVETFVKGLDDSVKGFGEAALKSIAGDFEQMTGEIDQRRDALVGKLTDEYKASYERMSAMEEKLREENKSLWERIYDATVGLIKKILAFKDMLSNVLSRAAGAIGLIIAHPIVFLGNLVDAGKLGFFNFKDHILEHLEKGFMEWLFGAVAEAGIALPEKFDLPGILSMVMQVLGLTYANVRSRAVKILGEKVVKALETGAEIFKILITKGPAGLWEYIKEKIGDLKTMVIEKIKSFVMEKIVMAGITWVIGLLNPASAFFKACKAIYDIIMFFVEHGQQILDLVNSIIDSITAIANGAIGAAAEFVENSLARTIPVIIGFLAALLGVGGISEKIKEVIEDIREPINAAIDWVINKAVDLVKAVGGLLGFGKKEEPVAKTGDPEHDAKVTAGLAALDEEDQKREKEGKITLEGAEEAAHVVKQQHPVFKSIQVVEGPETWDYDYTASPGEKKTGARKAPGASQAELESQVKHPEPNYPTDGMGRAKGPEGFPPKRVLGGDREELPPVASLPGGAMGAYQEGDHRGHLIGDRFGGEAVDGNLVPMSRVLNLSTFKVFENKIAAAYENWKKIRHAALIKMHIVPKYPKNVASDPESYRPSTVHGSYEIYSLEEKGNPPKAKVVGKDSGTFENPDSGQRRMEVNLSAAGRAELAEIPGIGTELADRIFKAARKEPFRHYQDLVDRVPGIGEETLKKIRGEVDRDPLIAVKLFKRDK